MTPGGAYFTKEEAYSKTSVPNCPSTLYPNFWRYVRSNMRFTKEEVNFWFPLSIEGGKYPGE